MTTHSRHPRSNKKGTVLRDQPPLAACLQASGSLQRPRTPRLASPAPIPARKCEAARGAAHALLLSASAQNFEPVHVKLSLPVQSGIELWETLGSDDCGGWARALFFFSTFPHPLSPVLSFGSSSFLLPLGAGLSPRPVSPPLVYAICWGGGDRRGCPVFTRGTARRGRNFDTGKNENKYLNTDARIRCWDTRTSGSRGGWSGRR